MEIILVPRYIHLHSPKRQQKQRDNEQTNTEGWLGSLVVRALVLFPAAATNTGMDGQPLQYFTKPSRQTQPLTLSGTGNEYQPKCDDG